MPPPSKEHPKARPATQNVSQKSSGKISKLWGKFCLFLCLKCSKTHLQASLIPKFSRGDNPLTPRKNGRGRRGREAKAEGEIALWLSGDGRPVPPLWLTEQASSSSLAVRHICQSHFLPIKCIFRLCLKSSLEPRPGQL